MAGGVFSSALLNGMTIRESATDGSDFTNPAADYRRLFLGEDGVLHLKDSAGTVTDIGGSSGSVATDAIWDAAGDLAVGSGANTAAKLAIGNAGGVVARINGAVAWNAGTAFPTATTGDRYFRTDRGLEYYYDGTRWLSMTLYTHQFGTAQGLVNTATAGNLSIGVLWQDYDMYLVDWHAAAYVVTTNNGTSYWTMVLTKTDGASASDVASVNTSAHAADTWVKQKASINALVGTGQEIIAYEVRKTSSPGNIVAAGMVTYRLVG